MLVLLQNPASNVLNVIRLDQDFVQRFWTPFLEGCVDNALMSIYIIIPEMYLSLDYLIDISRIKILLGSSSKSRVGA